MSRSVWAGVAMGVLAAAVGELLGVVWWKALPLAWVGWCCMAAALYPLWKRDTAAPQPDRLGDAKRMQGHVEAMQRDRDALAAEVRTLRVAVAEKVRAASQPDPQWRCQDGACGDCGRCEVKP